MTFRPSQLFGPLSNKTMGTSENGPVRPSPHRVHNSSRGKGNWFPFFSKTRKDKGWASAPRLLCFPEEERVVLWISAPRPGASVRVYCQMVCQGHLLNLPARRHWSVSERVSGGCAFASQHLLQMFFTAGRVRGWWNSYRSKAYFVYLVTCLCMYVFMYLLEPGCP